jgi:DNA gyrase subunit A
VAKRKRTVSAPSLDQQVIIDTPLEEELSTSYMEYALSVIVSRAIPDARDGLKPVQRRLLYAMDQSFLSSDKPYRKSIAAVGETMKKYHPHGDAAIYETLVRMAQPWVMNATLVDGHGNFGSLDDGPAASRYTEARLSQLAEALLRDVDQDTVDMHPNFDASTKEPSVLPAAFPNLLVNGASGIAVGMATSLPPHNLTEVVEACVLLLDNPNASLRDILKVLPAPDFPTGGVLMADKKALYEMYSSGKGSVRVRAKTTIEQLSPKRQGIVVTELPYNVGPEKIISRVKELVAQKKLDGISDIADHTDRKHGLRLLIEVKSGHDPMLVLSELYRLTPMEESFSMNAVALLDGVPQVCSLKQLLDAFVTHRLDVIVKRSQFRLDKANQRIKLLSALIKALDAIDEVVKIIRASKDTDTARQKLCKLLTIDKEQAEYILDMPLRRLTALEATRLRNDLAEQKKIAKHLSALLKSKKMQSDCVKSELSEVLKSFPNKRKSAVSYQTLSSAETKSSAASKTTKAKTTESSKETVKISNTDSTPWFVVISPEGNISRSQEPASGLFTLNTTSGKSLVLCNSKGLSWALDISDVPLAPVHLSSVVEGPEIENLVGMVSLGDPLALVTRQGLVKRIEDDTPTAAQFSRAASGLVLMNVAADDELISVSRCLSEDEIVCISSDAQLLRMRAAQVRPQGRSAAGMAGMRLRAGSQIVAAAAVSDPSTSGVALVTDALNAKWSPLSDYPLLGRATSGVRAMAMKKADTNVANAFIGLTPPMLVSLKNKITAFPWTPSKRDASGSPIPFAIKHLVSS